MRAVAKISLVLALLFPFSSFAALTGTVITTDGTPVSGAKITAYALEGSDAHIKRLLSKNPERPALGTAQSDSKGNFSIDPQKETMVELRVDATGFAPEGLRLGVDEEIGTIALDPAETRKGRITANGKPLAGAQVIFSALGGILESISVTAQDGTYSVVDPNAWAGRLVVMHPDFATVDQPVGRMGAKMKLDQSLTPGTTLTGKVVSSDGQTPVAKATITIDGWPVAQSGDDGSFSVPHAGANWALMQATADDRVAEHARDKSSSATLKLAKGASIRGTVRDARTQSGIAGVEVRTSQLMSTFTDAKGNYALGPLPAGHYDLTAIRPQFGISNTAVLATSGQAVTKSLLLTMRAQAVGSVVDEEKHPVAGARVSTQAIGGNAMNFNRFGPLRQLAARYTGPDGRFVLRGVEPDADIQLDAVKKGYPAGKSGTMRLASGERKGGIVITIPQGVTLTGRVTDKDGKPLSGVAISSSLAEGGGPMGMRRMVRNVVGGRNRDDDQVRTSSDGTFTVRLKEGIYDLGFKREGFAAKDVHAVQVSRTTKPLEVTLNPGLSVAGRVTRGGAGIEGVDVMVMGESGFQSATTGPDGSFRIEDLTPGPSMINVNKRDDFIQRVQPVTVPNENLVIDLPAGGRISGRVVTKDSKQPITQFEAGISNTRSGGGMSIMMPPQLKSFSSDDGTFVLENVPPGPVTVVANAPGYASGRVAGLNLEDGKALTDIEIALESGVHLSGKVTASDGSPVSGATVRLDTGSPGGARVVRVASGPDSVTTTDPNGEYSLDSVESGEKTFIFSKQGYVSVSKTATLSGKEARLDAQLGAGMPVRGTVVTDGGAPVGEANVRAMSAAEGAFGRSTVADANGNFEFEGLAPGHYSFVASKAGLMDGRATDVDITTAGNVRLVLKSGGIILGHVSGLSADQLQQVTVTANGSGAGSNTSVDSTGNFRIEGAPVGTVRVAAQYGRGFGGDSRSTPVKSVEVTAGGSAQVDLEFSSDITVRGRVTRSGQPLASVMVSFFPKGGGTRVQTTTDSNGSYTASGFEPGTYTVQVFDLQRMTPYTTNLDVKSSTTFDVDMKVATVRGRVIDAETGDGIPEAQVDVRASDGTGGMLSSRGAPTDPNGSFTIENVSAGSYQVTAAKDGYGNQSTDLVVGDSSPDDLTIRLSKSGGTRLQIVDARDRRPLDASARVLDTQGRAVSQDRMRFDPNGGTIKLNLNPGRYQATIFAQGYAPQTFDIMVPGDQTLALTPGGTILIRSHSDKAARARLIQNGQVYIRGPFQTDGAFRVDPKPGITQVSNVASGSFTLQLLDANDNPIASVPVTVIEGQTVTVDL